MNEVTRIRVQRAARFIRYSDMNLQEIAIRVGFATSFRYREHLVVNLG